MHAVDKTATAGLIAGQQFTLQQGDIDTLAGQCIGGAGPARAAANNGHITMPRQAVCRLRAGCVSLVWACVHNLHSWIGLNVRLSRALGFRCCSEPGRPVCLMWPTCASSGQPCSRLFLTGFVNGVNP